MGRKMEYNDTITYQRRNCVCQDLVEEEAAVAAAEAALAAAGAEALAAVFEAGPDPVGCIIIPGPTWAGGILAPVIVAAVA